MTHKKRTDISLKGRRKVIREKELPKPIYKHYGLLEMPVKEIKPPFNKKTLKKLQKSRYKKKM
ncbi:MAG: hypothetical protein JSV04_14640 [Candidatus Heimdallarchaeota archaeon]|nr:MAG: hypothetical protein JSV04_14640 [Candidatus Heimdallarchaeota archaeon]